jgi:Tol biopolymer transport system component
MSVEERVRATLRQRAGSVAPDGEPLWDGIRDKLGANPRSPRRGSKLIAVATALVLSTAAIVLAARAFHAVRPAETPTPPASPLTPWFPEQIAFIGKSADSGLGVDNREIYAVLPGGNGLQNMTTSPSAVELQAEWSPDGSKVAFVSVSVTDQGGGGLHEQGGLYVMGRDGSGLVQIRSCEIPCSPPAFTWSPDGQRIAFVESGREGDMPFIPLLVASADGSSVEELCRYPECPQFMGEPAWAPDGRQIAFSEAPVVGIPGPGGPKGSIHLIGSDGSGHHELTREVCSQSGCNFDHAPTWSPDGSKIVFFRTSPLGTGQRHQILSVGLDGEMTDVLTCDQPTCYGLSGTLSPDGRQVAYVSFGEQPHTVIHLLDLSDGSVHDFPTCLNDVCVEPIEVAWSPNGMELAFLSGQLHHSLYTMASDGTDLQVVASEVYCCAAWLPGTRAPEPESTGSPTPSGDGLPEEQSTLAPPPLLPWRLAYSTDSGSPDEDYGNEIFAVRSDGSHLRQLTDTSGPSSGSAWSPDGSMIAFQSYREDSGNTNIYVMNADGSDQRALTDSEHGAGDPAWSPNGTTIVFVGDEGIRSMYADGSHAHVLTEGNGAGSDPAWSPDGSMIVFTRSDEDGSGSSLHVMNADGSDLHPLTDLPGSESEPAWSPDGLEVAFEWYTSAGHGLYAIGIDGSGLRRIADLHASSPAWSPDGEWIAFAHNVGLHEDDNGIYIVRRDGTGLALVVGGPAGFGDPAWSPAA